ncbi:oxidative damage protection protein [Moraxella lacunata]
MPNPPFPNAKGEELQNTVSQKAWSEWLELQTMLINEKHLSMVDKDAKKFIAEQRELFLDNGDYERPAGFKPKDS